MSDFDPALENIEDQLGLEKLTYSRFYNAFVVMRPSQAPTKFDDWNAIQLPNDSILHTVNGFDTLVSPNNGMPNPNLTLTVNEKLPVFLKIAATPSDDHSTPFGVKETYNYRASKVLSGLNHFFHENRRYHMIRSDRTLSSMTGVLTWIDYSPLNEIVVNGTLHGYRKFDILFRTILNMVLQLGTGKHHYILLPQGNQIFSRAQLVRSFSELTTSSLNPLMTDPSIYPMLHLLGYVYGQTHKLKVTPYKEDTKLLGKEASELTEVKSTSLLERIPEAAHGSINFILQRDNKAVVYNLADLTRFAQDAGFFVKFHRHIMNLRLAKSMVPEHVDVDSEQFDSLVDVVAGDTDTKPVENSLVTKDTSVVEKPVSAPTTPVERYEPKQIVPAPNKTVDIPLETNTNTKTFEEKIREKASTVAPVNIVVDQKIASKRTVLLENHFNATLGGKTLGELIQTLPPQAISPKKMDFIHGTPEESYKTSSLVAIDRAYQQHAYKQDLAKTISSLAKHGLYVSKIEEDATHTEMDRTVTYKIHLSDLTGKSHHVKFTLPDIDDNGLMKLGGIEYRLTRQIANIPICKISPTRVNLSSYYNKTLVERIQSKRNSYETDINRLIVSLKLEDKLTYVAGVAPYPTVEVPYDYTAIGRNFLEITVDGYHFYFTGNGANPEVAPALTAKKLSELVTKFGTFVAVNSKNQTYLFWDKNNQLHEVKENATLVKSWQSFHHFLVNRLGSIAEEDKPITEWTQAKILNQEIPLVFILGYKLGLKNLLDKIKLDYRFYPTGTRAEVNTMDIPIKFADGTLVFNRYPLSRSLIAAGLAWVQLKDINFSDMHLPETYGRILLKKQLSIGMLKGIDGFYDFFVDPKTEQILQQMKEPTTFPELLLRANIMLTDYHADEASAIKNHRFRLYERFNGIVYKEIYLALSNYRNNPSTKKSFSINPEAVFQKIVQDATIAPNDVINPVHEVKQRANFTFTGDNGRIGRSLVTKDLVYPKDALGVVSESVPDSSKVGITSYLSASPKIVNIHGIPQPYKDGDTLEPPQVLSIGSMVMPGGTNDDGKRNNYLSIQISHYVPNHDEGETLAVRTGYDEVLPHLVGDTFAIAAKDSGVVESIDERQRVIRVRYADKPASTIRVLKVPYLDAVVNQYRQEEKIFGILIPETDIAQYPMGGVFSITRQTNAKVMGRLRCETVEAIPDKEAIRKQHNLVQDFERGRYPALYYIRLQPVSTMIPGEVKSYNFADMYTPISGAYLLQKRLPNVKVGEAFKEGDVLVYNPGFFVPDALSKQVTFKHGVIATVALIEKSTNHEDACEISKDFSQRLKMTPCHQREIVTQKDAAILKMVKVGDHVETTDSLCIISDDVLIQSSLEEDVENLDLMERLNRQTPSAGYTGTISKIRMLYSCEREQLSDSLKSILKVYEKDVRDMFKALNPDPNAKLPEKPGWVAPGTKYHGVDFTSNTVVIEFMIQETLDVAEGDKICVANANKSIASYVSEKQHYTESGIPVDILFSTTSIINRIVASPFMVGLNERVMETLKEKALDIYFGED